MEDVFDFSEDVELLAEETYQLALESILRWVDRGDIEAIRKVATAALESF